MHQFFKCRWWGRCCAWRCCLPIDMQGTLSAAHSVAQRDSASKPRRRFNGPPFERGRLASLMERSRSVLPSPSPPSPAATAPPSEVPPPPPPLPETPPLREPPPVALANALRRRSRMRGSRTTASRHASNASCEVDPLLRWRFTQTRSMYCIVGNPSRFSEMVACP